MEKDYSLLRQFDLEAAKRGEKIHDVFGGAVVFVDGPDAGGKFALRIDGHFAFAYGDQLLMAPLCWVEGKPVYKGDVLYDQMLGKRIAVGGVDGENLRLVTRDGEPWQLFRADRLTWSPPKVKREGWIAVKTGEKPTRNAAWCSHVCETKEQAEAYYGDQPACCIRIEWEE